MGRKPQVQARIPNDLKENIDDYCTEHNVSQSDAVRRALELEYRDGDTNDGDRLADRFDDVQAANETAREKVGTSLLYLLAAGLGAWLGTGGVI